MPKAGHTFGAGRTASVNARVTPDERDLIHSYARSLGTDVSSMMRDMMLAEIDGRPRVPVDRNIEVVKRALREIVARGDEFGAAEFDALEAEVAGYANGK